MDMIKKYIITVDKIQRYGCIKHQSAKLQEILVPHDGTDVR